MRQIGTLNSADEAERFTAYLLTQEIPAQAEAEGDAFAIWVKNEDQLPAAKAALEQFRTNPRDARYANAQAVAAAKQRDEQTRREQARKNVVEIRGRWQTGGGGGFKQAPLTYVLIGLSLFVAYLTKLDTKQIQPAHRYLSFSQLDSRGGPPRDANGQIDGFAQIRQGQVWRLVTPIFIHYGLWHLVFNMLMLHSLGRRIEMRIGAARMGLMILAVAVLSNVAQFMFDGENARFGGMSGVIYGLFGYMWMKSTFFPEANLHIDGQTVVILLAWMFICMAATVPPFDQAFGSLKNVANTAHVVGLAVGMAIGTAPLLWRK